MATRIIEETDCDRCDATNVPVKEFSIQTGWDADPAGGPSQPAGVKFDLCVNCMARLLRPLLTEIGAREEAEQKLSEWNIRTAKLRRY